jgi:hypothetical protein
LIQVNAARQHAGPPEYTTLKNVDGFVGNFKSILAKNGDSESELAYGVAVMATGATALKPDEYSYGKDPRILTSLELDQKFIAGDPDLKSFEAVFHPVRRFAGAGPALLQPGLLYPLHRQCPGVEKNQPGDATSMCSTGISAPMVRRSTSTRKPGRPASSSFATPCITSQKVRSKRWDQHH